MLTIKSIVSQIQSWDWFVTNNFKDTAQEVLTQHRMFLRFAFGDEAYQFWVLLFDIALSPSTYMKSMDAALALLLSVLRHPHFKLHRRLADFRGA